MEMESFISRFTNENRLLLLDVPTIAVLEQVVYVRMYYYNEVRRHSVLNNEPPWRSQECWLAHVGVNRSSSEPSSRITLKPEK
jgi:hypothetical protein